MPNEKSPKKRDKPAARAAPLTEQEERIVRISLSELHPFKGYPGLRDIMPRRQGLCGPTRRAGMKSSPDTGAIGPASWQNWRTCL